MSAGSFLFLLCSVACVAGALGTVLARNAVRGAMGLLLTIVGITGLFLLLSAQFLAAVQLIVYAGAVVVLFVFVIMLLGPDAGPRALSTKAKSAKAVSAGLMALLAFGVIFMLIPSAETATRYATVVPDFGTVEAVGSLLFSKGIVAFEAATALLIVAVVGAIAVARGRQGEQRPRRQIRDPRDFFRGPVREPKPAAKLDREAAQ